MIQVTGLILAGGRSTRMGENKALLEFEGESLIQRAVRRLGEVFSEVLIVGGGSGEYSGLGVPEVRDIFPGRGPLGGLHAGLRNSGHPYCFLVACDMPFAEPLMAGFFLEKAQGAEVVVPRVGGHYEPLHTLYHRDCLPEIEAQLAGGDVRIIGFYNRVKTTEIHEAELRDRFGALDRVFSNINTPDDYRRALKKSGNLKPAERKPDQ